MKYYLDENNQLTLYVTDRPYTPKHGDAFMYKGNPVFVRVINDGFDFTIDGDYVPHDGSYEGATFKRHLPKAGETLRIRNASHNWAHEMALFAGKTIVATEVSVGGRNCIDFEDIRVGDWSTNGFAWYWGCGHFEIDVCEYVPTVIPELNNWLFPPIGTRAYANNHEFDIVKYGASRFDGRLKAIGKYSVATNLDDIRFKNPTVSLQVFRDARSTGQLPDDWREQVRSGNKLCSLYNGSVALFSDINICTQGMVFHRDDPNFEYCEMFDYYIHEDHTVGAFYKGDIVRIDPDITGYIDVGDEYYVDKSDNREFYDIVWFNDRDRYGFTEDGWYSDEDDCWYSNHYEKPELYLYDYHHGPRATPRTTKDTVFTIGFEVEKEDDDLQTREMADTVYQETGWVKERDGSLGEFGFEFISPVFDLLKHNFEAEFDMVKDYLNADYSYSRCGGHINVGKRGLNGQDFFNTISGYMPLLYALYPDRVGVTYCEAKSKSRLVNSPDKYSSVYVKDSFIEFRIFGAVKNMNNLLWRTELIRIMVNNPTTNEYDVLKMMTSPKTSLCKHLLSLYSVDKLISKINLFIRYMKTVESKELSVKQDKTIKERALKAGFIKDPLQLRSESPNLLVEIDDESGDEVLVEIGNIA
jgi:hypothetical protein